MKHTLILVCFLLQYFASISQVHKGLADKIKVVGDTVKIKINGEWQSINASSSLDTTVITTKASRQKLADSLGTIVGTKAASSHSHVIADVTSLQATLDAKALSTHLHAIADVTGLQTAINAKAATVHSHTIAEVTNLQGSLDAKAATSHAHVISDVTALQAALDLKAPLSSPTLVTPIIGAATGTSLAVTGNITTSGGSIGYATGSGGAVTQLTSKSTTVVLNKQSGEITMNGASLASATIVSFTFTNSTIAANDVLILNHVTTGTRGGYTLNSQCSNGSATIYVRNNTIGALLEAIVIRYVVIKGVVN